MSLLFSILHFMCCFFSYWLSKAEEGEKETETERERERERERNWNGVAEAPMLHM